MIFPRARRREDNAPASLARARNSSPPKITRAAEARARYFHGAATVNRFAFNDLRARVIQDLTKIRGKFPAQFFSHRSEISRDANRDCRALSYA